MHPLKFVRNQRGLKQYQLAASLGVPPVRLCHWESGKEEIPAPYLEKAAAILAVDVSDLEKRVTLA